MSYFFRTNDPKAFNVYRYVYTQVGCSELALLRQEGQLQLEYVVLLNVKQAVLG